MAKMTLLEMTQDILNDMSSDKVNDIMDTVESEQVIQFIKTAYYDLIAELGVVSNAQLFQLSAAGDTTNPTRLYVPDNLSEMFWLKYNKKQSATDADDYQEVYYLEPSEFLKVVNELDSTATYVQSTSGFGATILVRNDKAPTYWTSFDDKYIVMDSFDSTVDTSLQSSKTQAYGIMEPTWTQSNTFVPELPANAFPMFLARAKIMCNNKMKSIADPLETRKEHKLKVRYQTTKRRMAESRGWVGPNYGRKQIN